MCLAHRGLRGSDRVEGHHGEEVKGCGRHANDMVVVPDESLCLSLVRRDERIESIIETLTVQVTQTN